VEVLEGLLVRVADVGVFGTVPARNAFWSMRL
jgi:hypothetical protein